MLIIYKIEYGTYLATIVTIATPIVDRRFILEDRQLDHYSYSFERGKNARKSSFEFVVLQFLNKFKKISWIYQMDIGILLSLWFKEEIE